MAFRRFKPDWPDFCVERLILLFIFPNCSKVKQTYLDRAYRGPGGPSHNSLNNPLLKKPWDRLDLSHKMRQSLSNISIRRSLAKGKGSIIAHVQDFKD
jgi:hypothetical protein